MFEFLRGIIYVVFEGIFNGEVEVFSLDFGELVEFDLVVSEVEMGDFFIEDFGEDVDVNF